MTPTSTETYPSAQAADARMNQLSAEPVPEYSRPGEWMYWSPTVRKWIVAKRGGRGITLAFYDECPYNC